MKPCPMTPGGVKRCCPSADLPNQFDCASAGWIDESTGVLLDDGLRVFEDGEAASAVSEAEEGRRRFIRRTFVPALPGSRRQVKSCNAPGRITFLTAITANYRMDCGRRQRQHRMEQAAAKPRLNRADRRAMAAAGRPTSSRNPPALLDLRTLPVGTACEAMGKIRCANGFTISPGELFTIDAQEPEKYTGPYPTRVRHSGKSTLVAENQSARVVKHACPRCDEGMREIEYVNRVWFSDAVRVEPGTRATIVEWFSARTGKTNMDRSFHVEQVRFVRADVPPPSGVVRRKGVG